jgi:hypothetical protein
MPIPKYKEQCGIGVPTLDCSKILEGLGSTILPNTEPSSESET